MRTGAIYFSWVEREDMGAWKPKRHRRGNEKKVEGEGVERRILFVDGGNILSSGEVAS
jgi:hypothetical protein